MTVDIRVPATGNAAEDAVVIELRAVLGSTVVAGDVVAVLETAKASVDVEAPASGTVLDVRCSEGDEVAEHSVLFVIGEAGESIDPVSVPAPSVSSPVDAQTPAPGPAMSPSSVPPRGQSSPRARLLAQRNGIDIQSIQGSGPGGRVIVPDVLAVKAAPGVVTSEPTQHQTSGHSARGSVTVPVRGARKVTAQRMTQSLQDSAQVTLNRYVSADVLVAFSQRLRGYTEAKGLPKVGINDMVNFAVATVVPNFPAANSYFSWEGIEQFAHVDLGIAVDTGSALLVPVIRDAQSLSLTELAAQSRMMAERARTGALEAAEIDNATFTVTNLGTFGVHWFTPVLNPPQSCILGVGALHQPMPGAPVLLPLSLTFDHRALDGAEAARCLGAISDALENIDAHSAVLPVSH